MYLIGVILESCFSFHVYLEPLHGNIPLAQHYLLQFSDVKDQCDGHTHHFLLHVVQFSNFPVCILQVGFFFVCFFPPSIPEIQKFP